MTTPLCHIAFTGTNALNVIFSTTGDHKFPVFTADPLATDYCIKCDLISKVVTECDLKQHFVSHDIVREILDAHNINHTPEKLGVIDLIAAYTADEQRVFSKNN